MLKMFLFFILKVWELIINRLIKIEFYIVCWEKIKKLFEDGIVGIIVEWFG